jgi:hypothetical protein
MSKSKNSSPNHNASKNESSNNGQKVYRTIPNPDPLYAAVITSFSPTEKASHAQPFGGGVTLSSTVRNALLNPTRADEIRGWAKNHQDMVRNWRGDENETMMHWAFLSSWTLAADFADMGLSIHDRDRMGRTPMDWINDRLWHALVDTNTSGALSTGSKERLRRQSEELILKLWAFGARPGSSADQFHPGVVWVRSGAWDLLDLLNLYPMDVPGSSQGSSTSLRDRVIVPVALVIPPPKEKKPAESGTEVSSESIDTGRSSSEENSPPSILSGESAVRPSDGWFNWTPVVGSALHAWIIGPDSHLKAAFLDEWLRRGLDVDIQDRDGRTPLWYTVDAWLANDDREWRRALERTCRMLLRAGADQDAYDAEGFTPASLLIGSTSSDDYSSKSIRRMFGQEMEVI